MRDSIRCERGVPLPCASPQSSACVKGLLAMQVCLVGSRQFNTFGSHGSDAYVDFRHDHTLEECVRRLKEKEHCSIVGVEIVDGAKPVNSHPFHGGWDIELSTHQNEGSQETLDYFCLDFPLFLFLLSQAPQPLCLETKARVSPQNK